MIHWMNHLQSPLSSANVKAYDHENRINRLNIRGPKGGTQHLVEHPLVFNLLCQTPERMLLKKWNNHYNFIDCWIFIHRWVRRVVRWNEEERYTKSSHDKIYARCSMNTRRRRRRCNIQLSSIETKYKTTMTTTTTLATIEQHGRSLNKETLSLFTIINQINFRSVLTRATFCVSIFGSNSSRFNGPSSHTAGALHPRPSRQLLQPIEKERDSSITMSNDIRVKMYKHCSSSYHYTCMHRICRLCLCFPHNCGKCFKLGMLKRMSMKTGKEVQWMDVLELAKYASSALLLL